MFAARMSGGKNFSRCLEGELATCQSELRFKDLSDGAPPYSFAPGLEIAAFASFCNRLNLVEETQKAGLGGRMLVNLSFIDW